MKSDEAVRPEPVCRLNGIWVQILALGVLLFVSNCAPVIDNLPKNVPKGYIDCRWQGNPGFPLMFSLFPEGTDADPFAVYRTDDKGGRVRFAARPGAYVLIVSSIGDAEFLSTIAKGSKPFGPLPANEREALSLEVWAGMKTAVGVDFERQDSWSNWAGRPIAGSYLMTLAAETPVP